MRLLLRLRCVCWIGCRLMALGLVVVWLLGWMF